jgi:MFS family permease
MTPQVLSIIQLQFEGELRARAIGAYSLVLALGVAAGQIVGGLLVGAHLIDDAWRPALLVLDAALLALVLPLTFGRDAGWPAWVWLSLAARGHVDGRRRVRRGVPEPGAPRLRPRAGGDHRRARRRARRDGRVRAARAGLPIARHPSRGRRWGSRSGMSQASLIESYLRMIAAAAEDVGGTVRRTPRGDPFARRDPLHRPHAARAPARVEPVLPR